MNFVAVLIGLAAVLCVLDAAPASRKEEEMKRGGVSSSLHGNFYRSMHHPLFARGHAAERRSFGEKQDKQKKEASKHKKFVDVLGTSWATADSDPWGQNSDPWGNSWGDPWSDSSYNYYYVPWPRQNKRGMGAKTKAKKSMITDKLVKKTDKRDSERNKKDKKFFDEQGNYVSGSYNPNFGQSNGYNYPSYGQFNYNYPSYGQYNYYPTYGVVMGQVLQPSGSGSMGGLLGKKYKKGLKKILKDKKVHHLKDKKSMSVRDYIWLMPPQPANQASSSSSMFSDQNVGLFDDYDADYTGGYYRTCFISDSDEDNDGYYDYYCRYYAYP